MSQIITEKDYPIQRTWIIKSFFIFGPFWLTFSFVAVFLIGTFSQTESNGTSLAYILVAIIFIVFFVLFSAILRRTTFHYSFEDKIITLKQGIVSKQQRQLPYGVIQNILLNQDILDRMLNLASLSVENASAQGFTRMDQSKVRAWTGDLIGFRGNRIDIPGLSKESAENLKNIILRKIKENPIEDGQSGL